MNRTQRLEARRRRTRLSFGAFLAAIAVVTLAAAWWRFHLFSVGDSGKPPTGGAGELAIPECSTESQVPGPSTTPEPSSDGPINSVFEGLTTFSGNATRTHYGE